MSVCRGVSQCVSQCVSRCVCVCVFCVCVCVICVCVCARVRGGQVRFKVPRGGVPRFRREILECRGYTCPKVSAIA